MIKIGLTGGIGSGKTLVSHIFERLNIPVFYADIESKRILNENEDIIIQLKQRFGNDIYQKNGINKARLASIIFNDNEALQFVQNISHPKVRRNFLNWAEQQHAPYVIMEAAILFETGGYEMMDFNVLVYAPEELRIQRVMERDGVSEEQVRERLNKQMTDKKKVELADWIIYNDGKNMLIPQVVQLDKDIKEKNR
jgi:dephospho-CoA kinase